MIHVWHAFAKILPEGQQAIDKIGKFVLAAYCVAVCDALGCRGRDAGLK